MTRFKFWILIGGGVLLFLGWQEQTLSGLAKTKPAPITLAQLASNGPGENAHLVVGDFFLCTWDYVYAEKRGRWTEAWVPAVPLNGPFHEKFMASLEPDGTWPDDKPFPVPENLAVVFKLTDSPSEDSVDELAMSDTVQGLLINEIDSIASDERALLQSSYPAADFDKVHIFEPGRAPKAASTIYAMLGGGAVLFLAGLALMCGVSFQKKAPVPQPTMAEAMAESEPASEEETPPRVS